MAKQLSELSDSEVRFNRFYHALLDEFVLPRDPHMLHRFKQLYLEYIEDVLPGESDAAAKLIPVQRIPLDLNSPASPSLLSEGTSSTETESALLKSSGDSLDAGDWTQAGDGTDYPTPPPDPVGCEPGTIPAESVAE